MFETGGDLLAQENPQTADGHSQTFLSNVLGHYILVWGAPRPLRERMHPQRTDRPVMGRPGAGAGAAGGAGGREGPVDGVRGRGARAL
jgi:hypothetical protein